MYRLRDVTCRVSSPSKADDIERIVDDMRRLSLFSAADVQGAIALHMHVADHKLHMLVQSEAGSENLVSVSVTPLRRLIKDYRIICDTYSEAVSQADPSRVETIDMGRKSYHDEGGEWFVEACAPHIITDLSGGRYLFSLVNVLYL